jgi:hypothetical protein
VTEGIFQVRETAMLQFKLQGDNGEGKEVTPNEVYRFLITYYIYQDQLSWSRIQSLAVVQIAISAGSLTHGKWQGALGLFLAAGLVALIWLLIERDWEIRDHHLPILDTIHKPNGIEMTPDNWLSGAWTLRIIFVVIITFDIVAAIWLLCVQV